MKMTSCSLPQLYPANETTGHKQELTKHHAGGGQIEKLPTISISLQPSNGVNRKTDVKKDIAENNVTCSLPQPPSVAAMTTTFRESYQGLFGPPATSTRRKEVLPGPHKVGPSSYSVDFCPKPLRKRTPPRVREGNILNSYPGNVLYPYKLPEEIITIWKPFPVKMSDCDQTEELLTRLVSKMYRTSYQLDFQQ